MRIIRTIILLGAAAIFLPSPPQDRPDLTADQPSATEFLSAALSTVADLGDFCSRQAAVCDTAHYLAATLEGKARYSIELLYQRSQESKGTALTQQASDDDQGQAASPGQNTLRLEDLIPEWRAPKSRQQG